MANKVKYGLKNVHYAIATIADDGSATYAAPVAWPGAVNLSLDAEGDVTKFRADNINYWVGNSNSGYSGDFESALIPDHFRRDVLGEIEDDNGVFYEVVNAPTVYFALMFQFEGDEKAARHIMYNVSATRPSTAGQTTEETIEPQTETITLTASSVFVPELDEDLVKARCYKGDAPYSTWFDAVYIPGGASPSPEPTPTTTYTVTFDSDGGSEVEAQTVEAGQTATRPEDPTKEDYTFQGWLLDGEEFDFTTAINEDITLTAYWEAE